VAGSTATPRLTPPPTDALTASSSDPDDTAFLLLVLGIVGTSTAAVVGIGRPGQRRRS
jgi:hypothetical protein